MTSPTEEISVSTWNSFLKQCRWYGHKDQSLVEVELLASESQGKGRSWSLLQLKFESGNHAIYQVSGIQESLGEAGQIIEDPASEKSLQWLSDLLERDRSSIGSGEFKTVIQNPISSNLGPNHSIECLTGEMSNTLIRLGDGVLLKLYRSLEFGPNPEVLAYDILNREGFKSCPKLYSSLSFKPESSADSLTLALWFEDLGDCDDLWTRFIEPETSDADIQKFATHLGKLTAEFHGIFLKDALSQSVPQQELTVDLAYVETLSRLSTLESRLSGRLKEQVIQLISRKTEIDHLLGTVPEYSFTPIQVHGDYHLGQVLLSEDDERLVVFDFEGEPLARLEDRLQRFSPLKDIASMLRSFSYAQVVGKKEAQWKEGIREAFLDSYIQTALSQKNSSSLLPSDPKQVRSLLRFFELQKAFREMEYELAHRPDWLHVPVSGVLEALIHP